MKPDLCEQDDSLGEIEQDYRLVNWITFYGSSTQLTTNTFWLNSYHWTEKRVCLSIRYIRVNLIFIKLCLNNNKFVGR